MDEKTKQLIEQYDAQKKQTRKRALLIIGILLGAALIVSTFLFRTQYPLSLKDRGKLHYVYSHVLLRDRTEYDYFNNVTDKEKRYYIVYRNASLYYEQPTDFVTYAAHASKENTAPGITNHAVIRESVEKYTFVDKSGNTYCYDEKTSVIKALFDASFAGGKIYVRFLMYAIGAAIGTAAACALVKDTKRRNKP